MKYGITWWGKQWLNSLNRIDYSNRLERGLTYADNGAVVYISYISNKIIAKVQGTRDIPYNVSIEVPEFSNDQKKLLINLINSNPQILSKLLNNEISPELESLALENGIKIFPYSWKDFTMRCSCPDWVVPCKHIAAVIYLFASEIDKNPFILFKLHGLDLLNEFRNEGVNTQNTNVADFDNFYTKSVNKNNISIDKAKLYDLDLSSLSSERSSPFLLLAPSPVFYSGDFKGLFTRTADKLSNYVEKKFINNDKVKNFNILPLVIDSDINFLINDKTLKINVELVYKDHKTLISIEDLIDYFQFIQDKHLSLLNDSWLLIYKIYLFSLQLIIKKLYLPKISKHSNDQYVLQYVPAIIEESVKNIFDELSQFLSLDIIKKQINYQKEYLKDQEQELNFLC
ncbi:MAG: SWIM zinc finger family protein, partial [Bacteroidales bacterium]|nr:SWIM zinc finger family protein [Bacteroidales bacterium]